MIAGLRRVFSLCCLQVNQDTTEHNEVTKRSRQTDSPPLLTPPPDPAPLSGRSEKIELTQMRGAGVLEENPGGARRRLCRLKIWNNHKQKNRHEEDQLDSEHQEDQQEEREEQLEEISRRLILKEEELFSQDVRGEEEEDQLQRDFEDLRIQMLITIHSTFTSLTSRDLEVLRSAISSIHQQEQQDRRWQDCPKDRVPVWRPQKCLSTHNQLLQKMVETRLTQAAEENSAETDQLSSAVKKQVCRVGKRVKDDLLTVMKTVKDCYPADVDILNIYAGLYHQTFSLRLAELTASELEINDCSYVLFWVNHYYPHEILKHKDLDGHIKTACLGSLLLQDDLNRLEEQYLTQREEQMKLWLNTALKTEQENWLSGKTPELIDSYYFSPLAIDIIQVLNSSLTEFSHTIRDQNKAQRLMVQLENFLCSYRKCLEEFVKGNHSNVHSVIKAQLVCEQQLSDYITHQTGSLSEAQRRHCLDSLSAVRDCGYRCFTCPLHDQTKVCLSQLWTSAWADGSLPVVDSLLDHLNQQLVGLTDLKPACRQSLFCVLYQNVVLQYVKKTMKTRNKNKEQQVAGAQQMTEDAKKIDRFFTEEDCREASWLYVMLCSLAEILRLQDPASIQLEFVNLARSFPDLSGSHVTALLSLKTGLSAADIRSIRLSVKENRLPDASASQNPQFFSSIKVKWINNKMNQMGLKS